MKTILPSKYTTFFIVGVFSLFSLMHGIIEPVLAAAIHEDYDCVILTAVRPSPSSWPKVTMSDGSCCRPWIHMVREYIGIDTTQHSPKILLSAGSTRCSPPTFYYYYYANFNLFGWSKAENRWRGLDNEKIRILSDADFTVVDE